MGASSSLRSGYTAPILRQFVRRLITAGALTAQARRLLPVLLPVSLFVVHVSVFRRWIVDDAGIVFAVARNVARGQGIVCQAGSERIEAVSSLPWMSLMASAFGLGIFDLVWTPKVVSVALVVVSYSVIYLTLGKNALWGGWVALVGLCWVSLQTGFVVWSASGLENPLYVFGLSVLLACALKDLRTRSDGGCPGTIGVVAGIVGVTRPEGVLYVLVYPVWRILAGVSNTGATGAVMMRGAARYVIGFGSVMSAFVLFRWSYFGEFLPNPYCAKGGPGWRTVEDLIVLRDPVPAKLFGLMEALGGQWLGWWLLGLVCAVTVWCWLGRLSSPIHSLLGALLACSTLAYLLLPGDWMSEYRYATPFFVFFYVYASALLWAVSDSLSRGSKSRAVTFSVVAIIVFVGTLQLGSQRSAAFVSHPTLPIQEVVETGRHFERLALALEVDSASVLTPSVGGALLESRIRIYDLGMLCDRVIAHSLGEGASRVDRQRFYDYVFEEIRPTIISTSAYHSWLARLDEDPRFRRDYAPIKEYVDRWVQERYRISLYSGEFVRRDRLSGKTEARVREEVKRVRYFGCSECD